MTVGHGLRALAVGLALTLTAACQAPSAPVDRGLTLSAADEAAIGREQHPALVAEFGGIYTEPGVQAYVDEIGRRLVAAAGTTGPDFTFVVLNTDQPNALSLPGGYVYVTRGLVALANDEAELASALAHEIGHVLARHSSRHLERTVAIGLELAVTAAAVDDPAQAEAAVAEAVADLQRHSQRQEFEADLIGVRMLADAGYDPRAMVRFLETLRRHAAFEQVLMGRSPDAVDAVDMMSTHPRTLDRVERALSAATAGTVGGRLGRQRHLREISGILYGDDPAKGVVRGRRFLHPGLRLAFTAPPGFALVNLSDGVVGMHPSGALMIFDSGVTGPGIPMTTYLAEQWAPGVALRGLRATTVGGRPAAIGETDVFTADGPMRAWLAAVRFDDSRVHRFLFSAPPEHAGRLSAPILAAIDSLRRLSAAEAAAIEPYRLAVVPVAPGTRVQELAAALPRDERPVERLRVLNGLDAGEPLPGGMAKIIVD